jgi:hypothetical protein
MANSTATALAGISIVFAGGFIAVGESFDNISSLPPLATDLQALFDTIFQVAPVAGLLLVGLLIYQAAGGL